jgi:hypothetical protein
MAQEPKWVKVEPLTVAWPMPYTLLTRDEYVLLLNTSAKPLADLFFSYLSDYVFSLLGF